MPRGASIETSLRDVSAVNALLLILAGLVGVVSLKVADATVHDVIGRLDPLAETNREIRQSLTDSVTALRSAVATGAPELASPVRDGAAAYDAALARAGALAGDDPAVADLLRAQDDAGHRWYDAYAFPVIEAMRTDPAAARRRVAAGEGQPLFDAFRETNGRTQALVAAQQREAADQVRTTTTAAAVLSSLAVFGAAAIGFVLARRAGRWVSRPLRDLGTALGRLTGGDLATRVAVTGPVEVAEVAAALNEMAGETERLTALERQRAGQERLIRTTSRTFLQRLDEDELLRVAAAGTAEALHAERATVWAVHGGEAGDLRAVWIGEGCLPPVGEPPPAELVGVVRAAFEGYGVARIGDVDGDPDLPAPARRYLQRAGVRSILLAPLLAFEDITAVLGVEHCRRARAWSDADVAVALGLSRELGVALEHTRVFAQQQATVEELRRLDDAKAFFVSSVSHELRTPLASIVGYTEMLLDGDAGELAPDQQDMVRAVDRNAGRLLTLIDDLLVLSRVDAGAAVPAWAPVDVGELIDHAVTAVSPLLAGRHLLVQIDAAPRLPAVRGDRGELERVLINLLSNAFKFTADGGSVSVTASSAGGEVAIAVADTGIGIPGSEQQQVFSRFFRSSVTRDARIEGTGLGLAIVKGIVEDHGGRVDFASVAGTGTTFTVHLPAVTPSGEPAAPAPPVVRSHPAPGPEY